MFYKDQEIIRLCVEKLSEIFGRTVKLENVRSVGGGCISHASKLNTSAGSFFLKWNASSPADMFQQEAAGLREMRDAVNPFLIVPEVIWSKAADSFPGLILMEYFEPPIKTDGFEERLGRGIARLHHKTAAAFGFRVSTYCGTTVQDNTWTSGWPEFYGQRRIWVLVKQISAVRGWSSGEMAIFEKLVGKMPELLPHQTFPSLIHGDLWSGNYMYTAVGPALIDPACYYADREMELGMMQLFGGFSGRVWSAYQEEFPLPEGWQGRIRLYQLYHLLNHFLLFGGSYGSQALDAAKSYL